MLKQLPSALPSFVREQPSDLRAKPGGAKLTGPPLANAGGGPEEVGQFELRGCTGSIALTSRHDSHTPSSGHTSSHTRL